MAKKIPKKVEQVLAEAKSCLETIYAGRIKELLLFGSYARGDFRPGSDIDLLLLLDGIPQSVAEKERCLDVVCELSLRYDTVLSVIPMDFETYNTKKTPLILNVHREGWRL